MKKYTQEEFDNLPINAYGYKECPSGDYTDIKVFDEWCSFGERCSFGESCSFGWHCSFGEKCSFGWRCSFGEGCSFDVRCVFGYSCSFGARCVFGARCSFGDGCSFDGGCSFDVRCSFGDGCSFDGGCSFEDEQVKNGTYFACDRIGSEKRKTYFFKDGNGNMFVRAGCWFSAIDEFVERVKKVHGGTKYEREYLAAVELAKIVLEVE